MTAVIEPHTLLTAVAAQAKGRVMFCIPQHPQVNGLKKEEQDKVIKWHFCVMLISRSSYFHIENLLSLCGLINLQPNTNFSSINLFSLPINQPTWTSWIHISFYKVFCTYFFSVLKCIPTGSIWHLLFPALKKKMNNFCPSYFMPLVVLLPSIISPFMFFFSTRKSEKSLHRSVYRNHWDIL